MIPPDRQVLASNAVLLFISLVFKEALSWLFLVVDLGYINAYLIIIAPGCGDAYKNIYCAKNRLIFHERLEAVGCNIFSTMYMKQSLVPSNIYGEFLMTIPYYFNNTFLFLNKLIYYYNIQALCLYINWIQNIKLC